ncbi:hypothetical protein BD309DRAFT_752450 [Dichomitus squalens]|nr:hypothetical protein BD309DRAFT_752450 [Dichomitus squalens]
MYGFVVVVKGEERRGWQAVTDVALGTGGDDAGKKLRAGDREKAGPRGDVKPVMHPDWQAEVSGYARR